MIQYNNMYLGNVLHTILKYSL